MKDRFLRGRGRGWGEGVVGDGVEHLDCLLWVE